LLEQYDIEALRCIYCGYCVEVCPVCDLTLTEDYAYVSTSKDDIYFTKEKLLKHWDDFVAKLDADEYWNKFWRPEGVDISKMPKAKREQAPIPLRAVPAKPEEKKPEENKPAEQKPEEKPAEITQSKENA
jgi:NADH-quinone oxidoreductase subunit I